MVFGGYDLVCCYRKEKDNHGTLYHTAVVSRPFVDQLPLETAGLIGNQPGTIQVQVYTSRPLLAQVMTGKSSKLEFWQLLKNIITNKTLVEIVVGGEITIEVVLTRDAAPETHPVQKNPSRDHRPMETLPEVEVGKVVKENNEITLDLEKLADLVMAIIKKNNGENALVQGSIKDQAVSLPEEGKNSEFGPTEKEKYQVIDPKILEEMVRVIIREHEREKRKSEVVRQEPEAMGWRMANPDITSLSLGNIPSRPGLHQTFSQNVPPPKPADSGG